MPEVLHKALWLDLPKTQGTVCPNTDRKRLENKDLFFSLQYYFESIFFCWILI